MVIIQIRQNLKSSKIIRIKLSYKFLLLEFKNQISVKILNKNYNVPQQVICLESYLEFDTANIINEAKSTFMTCFLNRTMNRKVQKVMNITIKIGIY